MTPASTTASTTTLRLTARLALLSAALLAASCSWAGVTPGSRFGSIVDAGGLKQGGEYQSAASATYAPDGNTSAMAAGASHGFSLHALAWTSENPTLPSYCTVYTCSWQTYANVTIWDTLYLTPPPGGQPETITFDFAIDGTKKRGKFAYGEGATATASYYFGVEANGWLQPRTVTLGSGDTVLGGLLESQPGNSFTVFLMGNLSVSARSGSVADYSHTMAFHLNLPEGWTYTSASGTFSPAVSAVPEPASMALMLCGLVGIAALKRRQRQG